MDPRKAGRTVITLLLAIAIVAVFLVTLWAICWYDRLLEMGLLIFVGILIWVAYEVLKANGL